MNLRFFLNSFFSSAKGSSFLVQYWDGEEVNYGDAGSKEFKLIFHKSPGIPGPDLTLFFGEAYMDGVFDVEGNWDALFRLMETNSSLMGNSLVKKALGGIAKHTLGALKRQQKNNITSHYDISNDFYKLWLDENMVYSCAFFHSPDDSLETAQANKINLCLDKLFLTPGMRLLDIGCGWGQLAIAAAKRGVQVVGITLSEEQKTFARARVEELGLAHLVDIRSMDYLDLDGSEVFDRIVSVGMYEHVGEENFPRFFDRASKSLKESGLMLLHTITRHHYGQTNAWIKKYIFPGGHIPTVASVVEQMPTVNMNLMHVDSLRLHYAYTLDHWLHRFDKAIDTVSTMFDERFIRMWRLYLIGSASQFREADLDIHQFLMTKNVKHQLPINMGGVYPREKTVPIWNGKLSEVSN